MKILFINLPYQGHVVPTIGFVQELLNQGCEVTYLMPLSMGTLMLDDGLEKGAYRHLTEEEVTALKELA